MEEDLVNSELAEKEELKYSKMTIHINGIKVVQILLRIQPRRLETGSEYRSWVHVLPSMCEISPANLAQSRPQQGQKKGA